MCSDGIARPSHGLSVFDPETGKAPKWPNGVEILFTEWNTTTGQGRAFHPEFELDDEIVGVVGNYEIKVLEDY